MNSEHWEANVLGCQNLHWKCEAIIDKLKGHPSFCALWKRNPWLPFDLIFQYHLPSQQDGRKLRDEERWTQNTWKAFSCVWFVSPWSFLNGPAIDVNKAHRESLQRIFYLLLQMNHAITWGQTSPFAQNKSHAASHALSCGWLVLC